MNLRFRVDATDILNHPTPANPQPSINSTTPTTGTSGPFRNIASKTGNRQIQGVFRLEF